MIKQVMLAALMSALLSGPALPQGVGPPAPCKVEQQRKTLDDVEGKMTAAHTYQMKVQVLSTNVGTLSAIAATQPANGEREAIQIACHMQSAVADAYLSFLPPGGAQDRFVKANFDLSQRASAGVAACTDAIKKGAQYDVRACATLYVLDAMPLAQNHVVELEKALASSGAKNWDDLRQSALNLEGVADKKWAGLAAKIAALPGAPPGEANMLIEGMLKPLACRAQQASANLTQKFSVPNTATELTFNSTRLSTLARISDALAFTPAAEQSCTKDARGVPCAEARRTALRRACAAGFGLTARTSRP